MRALSAPPCSLPAALLVWFVSRAGGDDNAQPWCDAHAFTSEDQYRAVSTLLSSWSHEQRVKRLAEGLTRSHGPSLGDVAATYAGADFAPEPRFEALRYSHLSTSKTVALLVAGELRTLPAPVMQRFFEHVGRAVVSAGFQYRWFAAVDVCSKSKPCGTTHEASAHDVRTLLETALGAAPEDVAVTGAPRCAKSCDGHAALARLDVTREVLACNGPAAEVWAMEQHRASAIYFQFAKRALGLDLILAHEARAGTTFAAVLSMRTDVVFHGFDAWFREAIVSGEVLGAGFAFIINDWFIAVPRRLAPYAFFGAMEHLYRARCPTFRPVLSALRVFFPDVLGIASQPAAALAFFGIPCVGSQFDLGRDAPHTTYVGNGTSSLLMQKTFIRGVVTDPEGRGCVAHERQTPVDVDGVRFDIPRCDCTPG